MSTQYYTSLAFYTVFDIDNAFYMPVIGAIRKTKVIVAGCKKPLFEGRPVNLL